MNDIGTCPRCNSSWKGDLIPEQHREHFGSSTHFSRLIAVEDRTVYDGAHSFMCPDCKHTFPRIGKQESGYRTTRAIKG